MKTKTVLLISLMIGCSGGGGADPPLFVGDAPSSSSSGGPESSADAGLSQKREEERDSGPPDDSGTSGPADSSSPDSGPPPDPCVGMRCDDGNELLCDGCESCEPRLWLVGPSVTVPDGKTWLPDGDVTFEAWAKTGVDSLYMRVADSMILRCSNGYVNFTVNTPATDTYPERSIQFESPVSCGDNAWHHVAASLKVLTNDPGLVRFQASVFWDGQPVVSEQTAAPGFGPRGDLLVGSGVGVIDDVRVSRVARYSGPFVPLRRGSPDSFTALLLRLDGDGTDASGEGHTGAVNGLFATDTGYKPSMCR